MTQEEQHPERAHLIRERNQRLVLRLIFRLGSLSQSKAVQCTGLKAPTVFRIFSSLEQRGLIEAVPVPDAYASKHRRKGRQPVYYRIRANAAYVVGVDFWARSAAAIIQDFAGNLIAERTVCFASPPSAEGALELIANLIRDMLAESAIESDKLVGIGVGAPGSVRATTGVVQYYARIPGMTEFPLAQRLRKRFSVPVVVTNNASIVALAEHRYGQAYGVSSLFLFLVRAGVGGAFIQNGKLVSDRSRTAFEVGHLSVDPAGPACSCGNRGCLELYLNEDTVCSALSHIGSCTGIEDAERILSENRRGADAALAPILEASTHAVRDIRRLLAPEAVVIVTRSKCLSERLAKAASVDFMHNDQRFGPPEAKIIASEYNPTLACKAACDLIYEEYFAHGYEFRNSGMTAE
ncbi:MAG: ROK family transcriptional regulator [Rectinema sp.]